MREVRVVLLLALAWGALACNVQIGPMPADPDGGGTQDPRPCPPGANQCDTQCVNLSTDSRNCGQCGRACPPERSCSAGSCCPAGQDLCGSQCVDLTGDDENCGTCAHSCAVGEHCGASTCKESPIRHVVLIVQENRTFDAYFGRYCTAAFDSNPTCTDGPACCAAAPEVDPATGSPSYGLTDADDDRSNYHVDRNHDYTCEVCEINGGKMDGFTSRLCPGASTIAPVLPCSDPATFMLATRPLMSTYWDYADHFSLADRYFQPVAGGTSGNDMFFATSHLEFVDNELAPDARGANCISPTAATPTKSFAGHQTIADVLLDGRSDLSFRTYADGYADAMASTTCPPAGGRHCHEIAWPTTDACRYDPSDVPFQYYPRFVDAAAHIVDMSELYGDIDKGTLPSFAYVKFRTSENEHPSWSYISDGESNVAQIVDRLLASKSNDDTLVLLTWDEGGGFYDHVPPPPSVEVFPPGSKLEGMRVPYGTRVPLLAIGRFARKGQVSHVVMEHSSIVKFLEWNFLGPRYVGAIAKTWPGARDGVSAVNNIGSVLDPSEVGLVIP